MFSYGASLGSGASVFASENNFPSQLVLSGWWRDYPGSMPWASTRAKTGSLAPSFATMTGTIPNGTAVNNRKSLTTIGATGGGGLQRIAGGPTLTDLFGLNSLSAWLLLNVSSTSGFGRVVGQESYFVTGTSLPVTSFRLESLGGVIRWVHGFEVGQTGTGAMNVISLDTSIAQDTFILFQIRMTFNGTTALFQTRVNGGAFSAGTSVSTGVGGCGGCTRPFAIGSADGTQDNTDPSGSTGLAKFTLLDMGIAQSALSDAQFDHARTYCASRYGTSV